MLFRSTVPFLGYVGVFLLLPTGIVLYNAFRTPTGGFTTAGLKALGSSAVRTYFVGSIELSAISAVAGAVFGAILAYAVASGNPDGTVRRIYLAGSGVLAQFGGVTLAFAFLVLIGPTGLLLHVPWYYDFPQGITLIYVYFQIPLMVLVFLPAVDGLKLQWGRRRRASARRCGSTGGMSAGRCCCLPSAARRCCFSPMRCRPSRPSRPGRTRSPTPCRSRSALPCPARSGSATSMRPTRSRWAWWSW